MDKKYPPEVDLFESYSIGNSQVLTKSTMGVIEEEKHIEKEAEVLELPQSMIQENEE